MLRLARIRALRRRADREVRAASGLQEPGDVEGFASQEPSADSRVASKEVMRGLRQLSPEQRDALILSMLKDIPVEDRLRSQATVAKICGVTGRTIRNRIRDGLEKIRRWANQTSTG